MKIKKNIKELEAKYENNNIKNSDFDGHTEFAYMTFEEKLTWLSELAESIYIIRQNQNIAEIKYYFN